LQLAKRTLFDVGAECVGSDWHLTDNLTARPFVGFRGNNGQRSAMGLNG
jgi:hypothetical protein